MAIQKDDSPLELEAVRTTIVGGRPPGSGKSNGSIPRGIEVLVKKASVDAVFRDTLLTTRAAAACQIGLELDAAEAAMLTVIPETQLIGIIQNTKVSPKARPVFMGYAAAAMLVALGVSTTVVSDAEAVEPAVVDTATGDYYEEIEVRFAIQPDDGYLDDKLLDTGTIKGFVIAANGMVIPGATVNVKDTEYSAEADDEGYFEIKGLPPETYTIEAYNEEGGWINNGRVTVIAGQIKRVLFKRRVVISAGTRFDLP